jgi:hypothetical protein
LVGLLHCLVCLFRKTNNTKGDISNPIKAKSPLIKNNFSEKT